MAGGTTLRRAYASALEHSVNMVLQSGSPVAAWAAGTMAWRTGRAALAVVTAACPPTGGATATCGRDGGGGSHGGNLVGPPDGDDAGCAWSVRSTRCNGGDGDNGGSGGANQPVGMPGTCWHSSRAANSSDLKRSQVRGCTRTELPSDLSNLKSQIGGRPSQALRSSWPWFLATAARSWS